MQPSKNMSHPHFLEQKCNLSIKISSRTCRFETCIYIYLKLPNFKLRLISWEWVTNLYAAHNCIQQLWKLLCCQILQFPVVSPVFLGDQQRCVSGESYGEPRHVHQAATHHSDRLWVHVPHVLPLSLCQRHSLPWVLLQFTGMWIFLGFGLDVFLGLIV